MLRDGKTPCLIPHIATIAPQFRSAPYARFCAESGDFYRRLAKQIQMHQEVHLVAILPQPVDIGVAYLRQLHLPFADVHQVAIDAIPISGTPTILLVNSSGTVERAWIGKLPADREAEVMKEVGCNASCD